MQDIQIPNTVFFSKIKQLMEELYIYILIHHIQTHLIPVLQITLQIKMEGH
jgi:hypothetical protein